MYIDDDYIKKDAIEEMNNFELLVYLTEEFTLFGKFLEEYRGYHKLNLKIGNFKYDGDEYEIFMILDKGPKFQHIRLYDSRCWFNRTLTEQLIYGWDFKETKFEFDISIINNFYKMLNEEDRDYYDSLYEEVHSLFW